MTHTQSNRHNYHTKEQASSTNQTWGLIANKMITQPLHCIDTPHPNQHTTLSHCWLLNLPLFHLQLLCPIDGGSLLLLSHGAISLQRLVFLEYAKDCKDNCCTLDLFFRKCIFFFTSLHEAKMLTNWLLINLSTHKYKLFLVSTQETIESFD